MITREGDRQDPSPDQDQNGRQKFDKVAVLLTALTFFVVMAAGIFYLRLQFQSTYLNKSVVKLQSEVVEMEKKNCNCRERIGRLG